MTILRLKGIFIQSPRVKTEYLALAIILLLFICFPTLIRQIDITAAPIDPGVLSSLILAILAIALFKAATWALIQMIWPAMAIYSARNFETDFNSLNPFQRLCIYLGFYICLFFAFVLVLTALF